MMTFSEVNVQHLKQVTFKQIVPPHHFQTDQQEIIKTIFLVFKFRVQVESQVLYKLKVQVIEKVTEVD